jgi:hypothetical protein
MSTLKSSAEDLTLNADGSGNDVIIQSDGSTKAIITAEGNVGIGDTDPSEAKLSIDNVASGDAGIYIKQDQAQKSIHIDHNGNQDGIYIDGKSGITSRFGMYIDTDSLTSGRSLYVYDNSSSTDSRYLVRIDNDNSASTGCIPLSVKQDSTGLAADFSGTGGIRSAGGILFGTDTAAANALDDYEEGTWTPVFSGSNTAGTYTYSEQQGKYTKIGNMVTIWFSLFNITTSSAGDGNIRITGIPFSVHASPHRGCVGTLELDNFTFSGSLSTTVESGMAYITPRQSRTGNSDAILQCSDRDSDVSDFCGCITYMEA